MASDPFDDIFKMVFDSNTTSEVQPLDLNNIWDFGNNVPLLSTPTEDIPEFGFPTAAAQKVEVSVDQEPNVIFTSEPNELPEPTEVEAEEVQEEQPVVVARSARKRKMTPKVEETLDSDSDSDAPYVGKKKKVNHKSGDTVGKKPKLYEISKPFRDPEMERNRLNAINAKVNRDRKKKEREALIKQMDLLRKKNNTLTSENNALALENKRLKQLLKKHGMIHLI